MTRSAFPQVLRVDHPLATIHRTPTHGSESFIVVHYEGTHRKRTTFADLDAATLHAKTIVHSTAKGEAEAVRLTGEDRLAYVRASAALAEFGLSLDTAAAEYRDAKRLLRGASLVEAARFYASQKLREVPRRTVTEVFQEMLKSKRDEGLSDRYLGDLETRLGRFAKDFQCQIAAVSGTQIKDWVQSITDGSISRHRGLRGIAHSGDSASGLVEGEPLHRIHHGGRTDRQDKFTTLGSDLLQPGGVAEALRFLPWAGGSY